MSVVVKRKRASRMGSLVPALFAATALSVVLFAGTARADEGVTVSLLTMGPGDPTFSKFGHDAIVVEAPGERVRVYNFGTFSFQSKTLFQDFLKGRLRYWLSVATLPGTLRSYQRQNRSLFMQELALEPEAADALAAALEENALPENKFYLYDHFRDNCATRVRDALDRATQGSMKKALARPASMSYRDHALRLVADDWPLYLGLDLGLGPRVDQPMTEWDEGFLPERLAQSVKKVEIANRAGNVPLVRREKTVFQADREPVREHAPVRAPWMFVFGALFGGAIFALFRRPSKGARIALGSLLAVLGLVSGVLGALLLFLWFGTNNDVAHRNANSLLSPVVALALVPAGVALAMNKGFGRRLVEQTLRACLALAGLGIVFALAVGHNVFRSASLFVPLWAFGYAGAFLSRRNAPVQNLPPPPK
jgi:hypothetical protein